MAKTIQTGMKGAYAPSPADLKREQDYQATDDLRTLHSAHKIKSDKGRHGRAMAKAKQHLASLKAMVAGKPIAPAAGADPNSDGGLAMPYGN